MLRSLLYEILFNLLWYFYECLEMLYNFYPSEHVVIKISNQLSLHYTYTCCLPSIVNIFSGKISQLYVIKIDQIQ